METVDDLSEDRITLEGRVTRATKRSNLVRNGSVWSSAREYVGGEGERSMSYAGLSRPSRNRNAESMVLRLLGHFSLDVGISLCLE